MRVRAVTSWRDDAMVCGMQDIVDELKECARTVSSVWIHDLLIRASMEIERLRGEPAIEELKPVTDLDAIDRRIAELESRVRLTQHRIAAAAQMCADIDRDPRFHTSIQVALSQVGEALGSKPEEVDHA